MGNKTILILGGYGGAGLPIARWLLKESDIQLTLAGRHEEKADQVAAQLNSQFPGNRVTGARADASDTDSLMTAFKNVHMVLVCSPTTQYTGQVAHTALSAGIDYMDIHYPQKIVPVLKALAPSIKEAGRCFISQAGFHPGLPAAFVRYAAPYFSHLKKAIIGMAMKLQYVGSADSTLELMEDISDYEAHVFQEGRWRKASGYRDLRKIDFGPGFGMRYCSPLQLEEMRTLPTELGLDEAGVYAAGFNWFVDFVVFPLAMGLGKIKKGLGLRPMVRLLQWGIKTFSRPPFGVVFKLEAEGEKDGKPQSLEIVARHDDGYELTAIPTVACLLQYLDGSIAKPGLWMMGHVVDPVRLFKDMERMGVEIQVSTASGDSR